VNERTNKLLAEWFWTDRWMGSSAFLLPLEPRGLYREMLTQAWRRGGSLPVDHESIQRAVGCTKAEWNRCWPAIEPYWRVDGDVLVNDTQLSVYADAKAALEKASARGRAGAQARAQARTQATAQARREQPLKGEPPSPSPEQDLSHRSARDLARARGAGNRDGVGAGTFPGDHLQHLACGPVCFTPRMTAKFIGRFGANRDRLREWARGVCARDQARVDAGDAIACGDDFDYWTAAYDLDFGGKPARGGADTGRGTAFAHPDDVDKYAGIGVRDDDAE
jgi:uncharacterized protein YdaU (DUF1376 family)